MPANVLFERDTNLPQAATTNSKPQGEKKPMSMEYHRQVLESRMKNGECVFQTSRSSGSDCSSSSKVQSLSNSQHYRQQQTYVSPSDNIQSPATQKLAAFKNKRLDKRYVCNLRPLLPLSVGIELTSAVSIIQHQAQDFALRPHCHQERRGPFWCQHVR